jgi:PII-like signaling protein
MIRTSEGTLLRIFIGDSDRHEGQPLHKVLVQRAHALGLAGATVLHGPLGFGRHARMNTAKLAELSSDLPVVIEFVDTDEAIRRFMQEVDGLVQEGLVTLESVRIVRYGGAGAEAAQE